MGTVFVRRFAALGVAAALVVGIASSATSNAAPPSLPPGSVVTCSQISGAISLRPGIGLTGTATAVKWNLKAVANNCTLPPSSAGTVFANIAGAIVKGSGYFLGGNTCAAAAVAANWGASTMKVQWISVPPVAATTYSAVAAGAFNAPTTIDATGITHDRNNVGPTPVQLQLGGDWTTASAAQLATDCSGAAPNTRTLIFQTPATSSTHNPAFVASI